MTFKPGDHITIKHPSACYSIYDKWVRDHFDRFFQDWMAGAAPYEGARCVVMGSFGHGIYDNLSPLYGVIALNPQEGGARFFVMGYEGLIPAGWGKKRSSKPRIRRKVRVNTGSPFYIRGTDSKWKSVSIKEFRQHAMKRQPMGCSCASVTDEFHGWECAVTGGGCVYMIPNALRCAEQFGEGPLALAH